jgi:hypothetical protein
MTQYTLGAIIPPNTKERVEVETEDIASAIPRIANKYRWIIIATYNEAIGGFEYYRYNGEKVFYYSKIKRWITEIEYRTQYE